MSAGNCVSFILPLMCSKNLTDIGWEFMGENRIPVSLRHSLVSALSLSFYKSYLGIEVYKGLGVKISFMLDDNFEIESATCETSREKLRVLKSLFLSSEWSTQAQIFVPNEKG